MGMIPNDEVLHLFIEESVDNISGLETDFMDIEEAGDDFDDELVNKVFRAIHSVKGGAGFIGLVNIKELSHRMENILNKVRNRKLSPTSEIIGVLLSSTDLLTSLFNDAINSNDVDISDQLEILDNVLTSQEDTTSLTDDDPDFHFVLPHGYNVLTVKQSELEDMKMGGKILYVAEYDMVRDIERKGKNPMDLIKELEETGTILFNEIKFDAIGNLDSFSNTVTIPYYIIFSTIVELDLIHTLIEVPCHSLYQLSDNNQLVSLKALGACPDDETEDFAIPEQIKLQEEPKKEVTEIPKPASPAKTKPRPIVQATSSPTTLRVNVKVLDSLMTLAGELVLTRNQLLQSVNSFTKNAIEKASQRVDLVTSELQEAIMTTRMQPIGIIFNKYKRIVHDMSKDMGKDINLIIEGKDVELDKTVIEAIADPMTHLVRNSVDHGIETPVARTKTGKKLPATLQLRAFHEAGQVIIEVQDDGAGIDPAKVKQKALDNGLYTADQLDQMSKEELVKLIFMPGFSLAKEVTDVSGRGVGMDVVNSNLTKIGGTIDVKSSVGNGTTISVKLPLTLAIIPSLIMEVEDERFAIPQVNLVELVRIPPHKVKKRIEMIDDASVMRLRGELLPVVRLSDILGITRTYNDEEKDGIMADRRNTIHERRSKTPEEKLEEIQIETQDETDAKRNESDRRSNFNSALNIVVVNAGDINYGIVVNTLLDSEEIVVKPLGYHLRECKSYAGATILGDGRSALILDIAGIAKLSDLKAVKDTTKDDLMSQAISDRKNAQSLVIVRNAKDEQFAVPLGIIARIEKINKSSIESPGGQLSMKYRGGNLRLFHIEDVAKVKPIEDVDWLFVIVFIHGAKELGVLVSEIIDAIDISVDIDDSTFVQPGILGSSIIMDQTTMLLDLYQIVGEKTKTGMDKISEDNSDKNVSVLVVEDSDFFRNHFRSFLENAEYTVYEASDGAEGIKVLNENVSDIDVILTDIEMPNMDGIEMTSRIRADQRFQELPILACTSIAGDSAEQRGYESGLDEYLIKLDRDMVLEKIAHYVAHGRSNS